MKVRVLGCGTSMGVPVIGCHCSVCRSDTSRNHRSRSGLLLQWDRQVVVIDTSADFRCQALAADLERVDAVLYTHAHADHICGLDDLRIFSMRQRAAIPCFASPDTLERLRRSFAYAFRDAMQTRAVSRPRLAARPIDGPFDLFGRRIVPVPLEHGCLEVLGFRIGGLAYLTDCNRIPSASFDLLRDLEVLFLDALRYTPHPTHFSVQEALAAAQQIGAARTYLTHLSHEVDYRAQEIPLPGNVELAYDGLCFDLS